MANVSLKGYVEAVAEAQTLEDAARALAALGFELGLERTGFVENFSSNGRHSCYYEGLFSPSNDMRSKATESRCATSMQRLCPVYRACFVTVDPFVWHVSNFLELTDPAGRMLLGHWQHAAKNKVFGGLTIPMHLPRARMGAVGWLSRRPDLDLKALLAQHSHDLQMAAHVFTARAYRERPSSPHRVDSAALTERELECLTWVALGKTDAEIGELIGRAASTARFHVDRAAEKLGVNNRARAAAVACQMGLVNALAQPTAS